MKKFIFSASLVVVLLISYTVSAYADQLSFGLDLISQGLGILYDDSAKAESKSKVQAELQSLWRVDVSTANSGTCITADDLYSLCFQLNDNGFSCYVYERSSDRYVIRGRSTAQITHIHYDGRVTYYPIYIGGKDYCSPAGRVYYATTLPADTNLTAIRNYVDGIEGYIDQIEGRIARTVDGTVYTVADSTYHTWQVLKSMQSDVELTASRLVMKTSDGVKHTVAESTYWAYQTLQDLVPHIEKIESRLLKTDKNGTKYTVADLGYNIWSRMSDLISAVNNQHITLDTSSIKVNVDGSNINLWNNKSYCCGYREDSSGSAYETMIVPYETATDILARLNTDYVGQSMTVLNRDGSTSTRYVRSACLLADGAIRVSLTNGYTYYLCDNSNVLYVADLSGRSDDSLAPIVTRLDTIIENQRNEIGLSGCDHQYVTEVSQEPTCALPGLMVYTCDLCGASYSEIMDSLGHDWLCEDHVEPVLDENGDIVQSGYDIYRCQICNRTYYDYDGTGAPDDESGSTITDLISRFFSKLGSFVGGVVSSIINLLDKLLTGFDQIVTDFNDRTQQILDFGGDYPAWLGGVWEIIPQEMQLALGFCIVVMALGIIGKKVVFS